MSWKRTGTPLSSLSEGAIYLQGPKTKPRFMITVRHQKISRYYISISSPSLTWSEKMFTHSAKSQASKRSISNSTSDSEPPMKKQAVTAETVEKWIHKNGKMSQTATWLKYNKGRGSTVTSLECEYALDREKR